MRRREPSPENVMRGRLLIMALAALVAAACAEVAPVEPEIGFEAQAYLNEALDLLEPSSVRRLESDWSMFRLAAVQDAGAIGANEIVDIHPVVDQALIRLGDGYSFFRSADGEKTYPSSSIMFGSPPST